MEDTLSFSSIAEKRPIIALDCDGVLLDDHATFPQIYEKAFGQQMTMVSPKAFRGADVYGVKFTPDQERHFYTIWDAEAWRTMPMIDGSLEACLQLHRAGYELVCITSMAAPFVDQRLENFRLHGFPIDRVISTGYDGANLSKNPKKQAIEQLNPVAFVDDSKRNFKDLDNLRTRLIYMDQYDDDPCRHESIHYDAQYANLSVFVHDFLSSEPHGQSIAWCSKSS